MWVFRYARFIRSRQSDKKRSLRSWPLWFIERLMFGVQLVVMGGRVARRIVRGDLTSQSRFHVYAGLPRGIVNWQSRQAFQARERR